jgi:hypothetical protein
LSLGQIGVQGSAADDDRLEMDAEVGEGEGGKCKYMITSSGSWDVLMMTVSILSRRTTNGAPNASAAHGAY